MPRDVATRLPCSLLRDATHRTLADTGQATMKLLLGSLAALLEELRAHKPSVVRVARAIQREHGPRTGGVPQFTARVIVTAGIHDHVWAEARFLVGSARAQLGVRGLTLPPELHRRTEDVLAEARRRIEDAGFSVADGLLAHDTASMDNFAL